MKTRPRGQTVLRGPDCEVFLSGAQFPSLQPFAEFSPIRFVELKESKPADPGGDDADEPWSEGESKQPRRRVAFQISAIAGKTDREFSGGPRQPGVSKCRSCSSRA